ATLYLAANAVIALDVRGTKRWETAVGDDVSSPQPAQALTLAGRMLLVQTQNEALVALDVRTGAQMWGYQGLGSLLAPVLGSSAVYLATSSSLVPAQSSGVPTETVVALALADGRVLWTTPVSSAVGLAVLPPPPRLVGTLLYVLGGPTGGDVLALRAADGS